MNWEDLRIGITYVGADGSQRTLDEVIPVGPDCGIIADRWDTVGCWLGDDDEERYSAAAFAEWAAAPLACVYCGNPEGCVECGSAP